MGAAGKVITKWFIAASVKPVKSQSPFVECAIFRNAHSLCKCVLEIRYKRLPSVVGVEINPCQIWDAIQ